jgi:hypothetical protein
MLRDEQPKTTRFASFSKHPDFLEHNNAEAAPITNAHVNTNLNQLLRSYLKSIGFWNRDGVYS